MKIALDYSKDLIEIPDLSRAPKLELVPLSYCANLCKLHQSIFTAPKLSYLDLDGCKKIKSLKTNIHSKSLKTLSLNGCSSLVEFSVTSENMTGLYLSGTAIHELPSSVWRNRKLTHLNLSKCKKLNIVGKKLLNNPRLESLLFFDLSGCTQINTSNLWFIFDSIRSVQHLRMVNCCNLEALPDNIQNISVLERLDLDECRKLKFIPKLPVSLRNLSAANCIYLDTASIQGSMFENMIQRHLTNFGYISNYPRELSFLPGDQVPCEFYFQSTEASIVIPPIPKSDLCCFIFCIIFSKGLNFLYNNLCCTIYQHEKEVHQWDTHWRNAHTLFSDHVLIICWCDNNKLVELGSESRSDDYNLTFEFKLKEYVDDEEQWSTIEGIKGSIEGIKGCGVFPVYDLGLLDGSSSSRSESVEFESGVQISDESDQHSKFDIDELQHATEAEVGKDCGFFLEYDLELRLGWAVEETQKKMTNNKRT